MTNIYLGKTCNIREAFQGRFCHIPLLETQIMRCTSIWTRIASTLHGHPHRSLVARQQFSSSLEAKKLHNYSSSQKRIWGLRHVTSFSFYKMWMHEVVSKSHFIFLPILYSQANCMRGVCLLMPNSPFSQQGYISETSKDTVHMHSSPPLFLPCHPVQYIHHSFINSENSSLVNCLGKFNFKQKLLKEKDIIKLQGSRLPPPPPSPPPPHRMRRW